MTKKNKFAEADVESAPESSNGNESMDVESEEEEQPAVRNRFDLLLQGDEDSPDAMEEEKSDASEEVSPVAPPPVKASKPQKKRNRRKKRKNAARTEKENDADWEALLDAPTAADASGKKDEPEEIDGECFQTTDSESFRAEANVIFKDIQGIAAEQIAEEAERNALTGDDMAALESSLRALSVEPRLLSADAELKKRFGFKAVEAERRAEEQEQAGRGRRRRGQKRGAPRSHLRRKFTLVTPSDEWFLEADGLNMVVDTESPAANGVRYFKYTHEASYKSIQTEYRRLVATHDIQSLAQLSARYPFHVDSLIQLAEVHRQMGEPDRAANSIERAIYVLESSWSVLFKPFEGDCRLRFEVPENKAIFVALFRYAQLLSRRGLHRTALEIAKLVLNFDPENDPMGVLMLIDSIALQSGQYEWVSIMHRDFKLIPVNLFPNFALSNALAVHHLQKEIGAGDSESNHPKKKKKKGKGGRSTKEGSNGGAEIARKSPPAVELLADALLAFPATLQPLLAATKDSGGPWSSDPLFNDPMNAAIGDVFYRISRVYAERSNLVWNSVESKSLLASAAQKAIAMSDESKVDANDRRAGAMQRRMDAMQYFATKGLYRNVQFADFADGGVNLPADVLAPEEAPINQTPPREVTTAEAMREFMQSLLPWRNTGDAVNDMAEVRDGATAIMQDIQGIVQGLGGIGFPGARNTDDDGEQDNDEDANIVD